MNREGGANARLPNKPLKLTAASRPQLSAYSLDRLQTMDHATAYAAVSALAQRDGSPRPAFEAVVDFLEAQTSAAYFRAIRRVSVERDVASLRDEVARILEEEPPPASIAAYYFGLFDAADDAGKEVCGFYIAGVDKLDPEADDFLCDPPWFPESRFLESEVLTALKEAELVARSKRAEHGSFIGYAGQLGIAMVLARFARSSLPAAAPIVVGFDDGDFVVLDTPAAD